MVSDGHIDVLSIQFAEEPAHLLRDEASKPWFKVCSSPCGAPMIVNYGRITEDPSAWTQSGQLLRPLKQCAQRLIPELAQDGALRHLLNDIPLVTGMCMFSIAC